MFLIYFHAMRNIPSVIILTSVVHRPLDRMLSGILRYAHEHGPWRIYQAERRKWTYNFDAWASWGADAIVAADHHDVEEAKKIAAMGIPVIVLLQPQKMREKGYPLRPFPCCLWDSRKIGQMAADYFIRKGYSNFAFFDDIRKDTYWSAARERAFRMSLPKGYCYRRYGGATAKEMQDWMLERPRVTAWLRELPKPCAVFAPNDRRGKQVLDAAFAEGISVPGDIGVLACDNDTWICEASVPTLSSIRCDTEIAGYKIAAVLDNMLHGKSVRKRLEIPVEPIEVVTRQSTDWHAVGDEKVAQTLARIQSSYADSNLCINDLARASGLARRTLEIRFKNITGRTIHEEIEFVRISKAKALISENRLRISEVAKQVGYSSTSQFCVRFKMATGSRPTTFANQN